MKNIKLFELILKREGNFWIEINDSIFLSKKCGLETIRFMAGSSSLVVSGRTISSGLSNLISWIHKCYLEFE